MPAPLHYVQFVVQDSGTSLARRLSGKLVVAESDIIVLHNQATDKRETFNRYDGQAQDKQHCYAKYIPDAELARMESFVQRNNA